MDVPYRLGKLRGRMRDRVMRPRIVDRRYVLDVRIASKKRKEEPPNHPSQMKTARDGMKEESWGVSVTW